MKYKCIKSFDIEDKRKGTYTVKAKYGKYMMVSDLFSKEKGLE